MHIASCVVIFQSASKMDRDVAGIRISPATVEFSDTIPNTVEQLNITVKNISKESKSVRFYGPKTKVFYVFTFKHSHTRLQVDNCFKRWCLTLSLPYQSMELLNPCPPGAKITPACVFTRQPVVAIFRHLY